MITLWTPSSTVCSDDAGVSITKTTLPPVPRQFPYPDPSTARYTYVPSLSLLCILRVYTTPDQLHLLGGLRLNYMTADDRGHFDLLRALIPGFRPAEYTSTQLDPRLWATLIQIYDELPKCLRTYNIPLSDEYLPLLQYVPSTPTFTLITVLNLAKCNVLTDNNVICLKPLTTLAALDASYTSLSDYGVKSLAGTIVWSDEDQVYRGPSSLRVLKIRGCSKVTNSVYASLLKLPLLCLVDLRNTLYTRADHSPFRLSQNSSLFDSVLPNILLTLSQPGFFSSQNVYSISVDRMEHPSASGFARNVALPPNILAAKRIDTVWDESDSSSNSMNDGFESDEQIADMPEDEYDDESSAVERYALKLLEEEARLEAARDKATSFYRRGVDRKRHTSDPKCAASAAERRNECMLLRQPPPWHFLNTSTTRALFSSTSKPSNSTASLHKGHDKPSGTKPTAINAKKVMKAKQALMDWDAQRRTLHSLRSTSTRQEGSAAAGPSSASTSRNPFARRFGDDGDGSNPASGPHPSLLSVRPSSIFTSTRPMLGPNGARDTSSKPSPLPPSNSNKTSLKKASSHKQLARPSGSPQSPSTASIPSTPGIILKPVTTLSVPLPPSVNDVKPLRKGTVVREIATPGIPKELSSSEENGQRSTKGKGKGTDLHAEMDATLARYSRRSSLPAYVGREDMRCSGTDGPVKRLIIKADDPPSARPTKRTKKETSSSLDKAKKTASRRESTQFDWKVWGMR